MGLFNSSAGYGALTKIFHWLIALLFLAQYVSAVVMLRLPVDTTEAVALQAGFYNWHKSLGLVALVVTVARLLNRRVGALPPWAPSLTAVEKMIIHRGEQLLYAAMLVMPLSGFVYVMAGGYGVRLFGVVDLPSVIGVSAGLAGVARWVHVASALLLLLPLGAHLGIVLGHHFGLRDRMISRMGPGR